MKFTRRKDVLGTHYVSGVYKCVRYGKHWYAYHKPKGWKNWGNSCFHSPNGRSVEYPTLKAAQDACEQHRTAQEI